MEQDMGSHSKQTSERYALVTGANKGIGFEICRQLAREGVMVILTARDEKRGREAVTALNTCGLSNVVFHQLDVLDPVSVATLSTFVQTQFGKLDILVNNAGAVGLTVDVEGLKSLNIDPVRWISGEVTRLVQGVTKQTNDGAEECLNTNYHGCKRVTQALLPLLQLSKSGARIVNVTSIRSELKRIPNEQIRAELGDLKTLTEEKIDAILHRFLKDLKHGELESNGWPMMLPAYSMSKVALNAYTRILAMRFLDMYINCVHPGFANTDINFNTGIITAEEGAKGPVMLALLPDGGPSGFYFNQTEISEF